MKNENNKTEFEIYMEVVAKYMATFMNELEDGNAHVVERTVSQMKQKFALDDAQEAALQVTLFNIEMAHMGMRPDFPLPSYVGLMTNVIIDIVLKDYRNICDKRLTEENLQPVDDYDNEDEEYYNESRMKLIKYYLTCMGKNNDDPTTEEDVLDWFDVYFEVEDDAKKVLDGFVKKMEEYRQNPVSQETVARLLDDTIDDMNEYNINLQ